jgi:hypothetical protein
MKAQEAVKGLTLEELEGQRAELTCTYKWEPVGTLRSSLR